MKIIVLLILTLIFGYQIEKFLFFKFLENFQELILDLTKITGKIIKLVIRIIVWLKMRKKH